MAMLGRGAIQDGSKSSTAAQRRKAERIFRRQMLERKQSQKNQEGRGREMTVSKEQAMAMFSHDLDMFMTDIRGLLAHYRIADWEAYLFFRKPDCPESYVLKYEATAGDEFAKQIVALHTEVKES